MGFFLLLEHLLDQKVAEEDNCFIRKNQDGREEFLRAFGRVVEKAQKTGSADVPDCFPVLPPPFSAREEHL
jgi:hypothetical protein